MAAYFSLILVLVTLISGLIWLFDVIYLAPKRRDKLAIAEVGCDLTDDAKEKILREPSLVETAHSIFPVIAFVMVLRSFIYEPFQIPSGSMMPTLLVGDFILVEKFSYGIKDPVWRTKLIETGTPKRGDIVVFKYPKDPMVDYIKRVVGLSGDKIIYTNKELWIQPACKAGMKQCPEMQLVHRTEINRGEFTQDGYPLTRYQERLGDVSHDILVNQGSSEKSNYFYREGNLPAGEWIVPQGEYFVMGDNRDNSLDSRFWGFVPDGNLVGKAVAIWMSFEFNRHPSDWIPTWVPSGVRFNRIGGIH